MDPIKFTMFCTLAVVLGLVMLGVIVDIFDI